MNESIEQKMNEIRVTNGLQLLKLEDGNIEAGIAWPAEDTDKHVVLIETDVPKKRVAVIVKEDELISLMDTLGYQVIKK